MKSKKKTEKKAPRSTNVVPEASSLSLNPPATAAATLKCRFLKLNGDVIESVEIPMKKVLDDGAKVQDVGAALAAKLSDPCPPVRQRLRGFADRTVFWDRSFAEPPSAWLLMRVAMDKIIEIDEDKTETELAGQSTFNFIEIFIDDNTINDLRGQVCFHDFNINCGVVNYGPWIAEELAAQAEAAGLEDLPHDEPQIALATLAPTDVKDLRRCLEVFGDTKPRKASGQMMRKIVTEIEDRMDREFCDGDQKPDEPSWTFQTLLVEGQTLLAETPDGCTTKIVFADEKRADIVRLACQVLQWLPTAIRCESDSVSAGAYETYSETFSRKLKSDLKKDWGSGSPRSRTPELLAMAGRFLRAVYVPTYLSPLIDDMETEHRYMRRHILKFICLDQAPAADVEPLEGSFPLSELLPFADATSGSPVLDLHVMGTV